MKHWILFFSLLVVNFLVESQTDLKITAYPSLEEHFEDEKFDFSNFEQLKKKGLPRKALEELKQLEQKAYARKSLKAYGKLLGDLEPLLVESQLESEEYQAIIWEYANKSEQLDFPFNNVLHSFVAKWVEHMSWRSHLSFDDESLNWIVDGQKVQLKNGDFSALVAYHRKMMLARPMDLMKYKTITDFESKQKFDSSPIFYTLFEDLAAQLIKTEYHYADNLEIQDSTLFQLTDQLPLAKMFKDHAHFNFELFYHFEKLNLINKRIDAYAYWVERRLDDCFENASAEIVNGFDRKKLVQTAFVRFENFLQSSPESSRFTFRAAEKMIQEGQSYHWKNNTSSKNAMQLALKKIETSLQRYPESRFKDQLVNLRKIILNKSLELSLKNSPVLKQEMLVNLAFKNVSSAVVKVYKIEQETEKERATNFLKHLVVKQVYQRVVEFAKDSFYVKHDLDLILPKVNEAGMYLVVVGRSSVAVDSLFQVDSLSKMHDYSYLVYNYSNIHVLTNVNGGNVTFLVTDALKGKPLKAAQIQLTKERYYHDPVVTNEKKVVLYTNAAGIAVFEANSSYKFVVKSKQDSVKGNFYASQVGGEDTAVRYKTYCDRGIYRPGQQVYVKVLGFKGKNANFKVLENAVLDVIIRDVNDQELHSQKVALNAFGTASLQFTLPSSGFLLGDMNVYINNEFISSFLVEEYKRPSFEVLFDTIRSKIKLGEALTVTGTVQAFAGYPVSHAKIQLHLNQMNYFPRWCVINYNDQIFNLDTTLVSDEKGKFSFTFTPQKIKYNYGSYFGINAIATDISGEVQEASTDLYVGNQSYSIDFDMDQTVMSSDDNTIVPVVRNSRDVEIKDVRLSCNIVKLDERNILKTTYTPAEFQLFTKSQFQKAFPNCIYFLEKPIVQTDTVFVKAIKSGEEMQLNAILKNVAGTYKIELSAIDENGEKTIETRTFHFIVPTQNKNQHVSHLWMESTKKYVKVGDEFDVIIGSSHKKLNVFFTSKNSQFKSSGNWIKLKRHHLMHFKVTEKDLSGFAFAVSTVLDGEVYMSTMNVEVENHEKDLDVKLLTQRDFMRPGSKEKWVVQVTDERLKASNAELLVGMYDASLDQFVSDDWNYSFYYYPQLDFYWSDAASSKLLQQGNRWGNEVLSTVTRTNFGAVQMSANRGKQVVSFYDSNNEMAPVTQGFYSSQAPLANTSGEVENSNRKLKEEEPQKIPNPRTNFNETAFFYPQIYADSSGDYRFEFTLPDALTSWRFRALAHTKDLKIGYYESEIEAKKEVMVEPNEPRFFREGDQFEFSTKVINRTEKQQEFKVNLTFIDPLTEQKCTNQFGSIAEKTIVVAAQESKEVSWKISVPEGKLNLVAYQIEASNAQFGDAERKVLPILTNKQYVVETLPLVKTSKGEESFTLERMKMLSPSAQKISYTVELQTQPLWTTLMNLPNLMSLPNENAEQVFSRFFGNTLAQKILGDNPAIKQVLITWKQGNPETFLSELEKNKELKSIILQETPWLLDAKNENAQRSRLALLFDENNLKNNSTEVLQKLNALKTKDGGWSWYGNEKMNSYITQYIVSGFGQLKQMGIEFDEELISDAIQALEKENLEYYRSLKKEEKEKLLGLSTMHIHWLVTRAYFDLPENEVSLYYKKCLEEQWKNFDLQTQALAGMVALKNKDQKFAELLKNSILDRATKRPRFGMYWNDNKSGYRWNQSPTETQSSLIQFFAAYGGLNSEIQQMQLWLLQQKQANSWESSKATSLACYALLVNKTEVLNQQNQEVSVRFGDGTSLGKLPNEASSKFVYSGPEITAGKEKITISSTTDQPIFGAMYVQYLDKMENLVKSKGDLQIERHYYIGENGKQQEVIPNMVLEIGTKLTVKLTVISAQAMEYVHVKDSKATGFESRTVLSGYHYSGVPYYQVERDASTDIFIDNLPKGTHQFEYELFVTGKGELTVGSALAECLYAPRYQGISGGSKFTIK